MKSVELTAVVVASTLLISGTYAWQSYSQAAKNEASGFDADQGTRLHDDFNGENKDIYVENYATVEGGAIAYTRVRLYEYMEYGDGAGDLISNNPNTTLIRGDELYTGTPDITDKTTWDIHLYQGNAHADSIRNYVQVVYGSSTSLNKGSTVYMPTFNKNFDNLDPDVNGSLEGLSGNRNTLTQYDDYQVYIVGTPLTDIANYSINAAAAQDAGDVNITETHNAQNTLEGTVISMADWKAAGSTPGNYWVYDVDGWAYWADALMPQTATSLLVDSLSRQVLPDGDWYYGLHVENQSATASSWVEYLSTMSPDGMTDDAKDLLEVVGNISYEAPTEGGEGGDA